MSTTYTISETTIEAVDTAPTTEAEVQQFADAFLRLMDAACTVDAEVAA